MSKQVIISHSLTRSGKSTDYALNLLLFFWFSSIHMFEFATDCCNKRECVCTKFGRLVLLLSLLLNEVGPSRELCYRHRFLF